MEATKPSNVALPFCVWKMIAQTVASAFFRRWSSSAFSVASRLLPLGDVDADTDHPLRAPPKISCAAALKKCNRFTGDYP
jgi:urease accessory protein UreF